MCNVYCCCRQEQINGLIRFSLIFTAINLIISFVAIFIRAAKTERYKTALMYLEVINDGTFNFSALVDCKVNGFIFNDGYYCKVGEEYLKKPANSISNQSLFKNWEKTELSINTTRTVITLIFMAFIYYVLKNKGSNIDRMNNYEKIKYRKYLYYTIFAAILMLIISALCIIIRALALSCNIDIGLYDDTGQNEFESQIATNYIFDMTEIVLYAIEICFIVRIKRNVEIPPLLPIVNSGSRIYDPVNVLVNPVQLVPQPIPPHTIEVRVFQHNAGEEIQQHQLDNFAG